MMTLLIRLHIAHRSFLLVCVWGRGGVVMGNNLQIIHMKYLDLSMSAFLSSGDFF